MKVCPNCQSKYPNDANFCPQETCATPEGPRRLSLIPEGPPARFQLGGRLGGSRSGEVWRAIDGQGGGEVAYKVVAAEALPTPAALERAQRELKQLQRAQSPRIARIIDFGKTPEGRLFVVTELVAGNPLDQLIVHSGPLPLDRVKKIVAQIGEALLEGQKVGVVHHDLAAKNVIVGSGDEVKIINFVTPWPVTETVFGVPEYLSPEQAEGKLVDQRSNTYSLGALLMLMITGQPPFSGSDSRAVIDQVIHGEITPPSRRRGGIAPEIDRIVMKALEKSSSRRPLTMRQFLNDVAALATSPGAAPAAAPPSGSQPGAAFAKTMVFAGGAPEVPRLVAQAAAARAEANGAAPAPAAPAFAPAPPAAPAVSAAPYAMAATPPPASPPPPQAPSPAEAAAAAAKRAHGAAIAATMVALPAANGGPLPGAAPRAAVAPSPVPAPAPPTPGPTPPPEAEAATPPPETDGASSQAKGAGNFRETLWFKKGDVEQMVAEAKAKAQAQAAAKGKPAASVDDVPIDESKPLEDRYADDGSVTVEDRQKFSLGGGPSVRNLPPVAHGGVVPGERMSDTEMLNEIGSGKKIAIVAVALVVVVALAAGLFVAFRGKHADKTAALAPPPAPPPAAAAAAPEPPPPPAPPPPAPAAAAAPAPAPEPEAPPPGAVAEEKDEAAPAVKAPRAAKKHLAAKKHAGKKRR
jgi:serine/threonine-protein kinase